MYEKRIFDLCKDKPGAKRKNGSIDHVTGKIINNYKTKSLKTFIMIYDHGKYEIIL